MDGLLIVDKPVGPSSHDVVARARRALGEPRIGHTGTLDPDASGVLPLVIGKATRLARFLSASGKSYDAVVRLRFSTNTYDAAGQPTGPPHTGALPGREEIDRALDAYRGTFMQQPPAYSAKKIAGQPSYRMARRADRQRPRGAPDSTLELRATPPAPARVETSGIDIISIDGDCVSLRVECSAGFYVRSLAHDLGSQLGVGGHLVALRRTRCGDAGLPDAVTLEEIEAGEAGRARAIAATIPLAQMLPRLPVLELTDDGVRHAGHGRDLGPQDFSAFPDPLEAAAPAGGEDVPLCYRLLNPLGHLVALAEPGRAPGLLHPFVVLM